MDWQIAIPFGSFIAGLMAFPHCALMCGPLFALFGNSWQAYHSGRIFGYSLMGAILGWLSLGLDVTGTLVSLQHFSIILIAIIFFVTAILYLLPVDTNFKSRYTIFLTKKISNLRKSGPPGLAIFLSGLLSALLPCGVLIPVWALSASSGSPIAGASLSLAFVLGTIPGSLLFRLILKQKWWQNISIRRSFRIASGVSLLIIGLFILGYRGVLAPYINVASPDYDGDPNILCAPALPIFN